MFADSFLIDQELHASHIVLPKLKPHAPGHRDVEPHLTSSTAPTTSVTRTYAHLHYPTYIAYCAGFSATRTLLYHPMTIVVTRKQGLTDYGNVSSRTILRNLVASEGGWSALSTGLAACMLANAASETIYSGLFELLRFELPIQSEVSRDAASGYTSDAASRFIYTPLLLVSNRQMTQCAPYMDGSRDRVVADRARNSFTQVVSNVYRAEGARGFYRGLGATITVGCSWSGIWWAMYVQLKKALYVTAAPWLPHADGKLGRHLPSWLLDRQDNVVLNAAASVVTSASTAVIFNPFLVVRTRMQIEPTARTVRAVCRTVFQEGGMRGFFRGTGLSVVSCSVDGIVASSAYEWAKYLADTTHHV